ncbi:MAG: hypothetical protein COY37_02075 [Candidatus Aquicultor secundus]|uniref:Glycosyltransferase subfamily 4-like N-terminal domain-containing protein n=2 Tax=Candidatus Aquicultor secundus TaxID=1973895 RepID=A0A2M7TAK9_9ACTN|nr:MAG: hypothetical protein COY37_02075 [Candidatus Aquicultor secundus]
MKICMVSKFPPIQGGIAARTYWLARGLAEAGHEITIVTNSASVEKNYKICGCDEHLRTLKNISVQSISDATPWHIPNSQEYTIRLLNRILQLLRSKHFDLIDAGYLVPYGIVAYLAHKVTSVPYVIRHGGSDIAKFMDNPEYRDVIKETISAANLVVTDEKHEKINGLLNPNTIVLPPYVPDERAFKPTNKADKSVPVFAYIGKVNFFWRRKGLDTIASMFKELDSSNYRLIFVAEGLGLEDFKNSLSPNMRDRISFQPFVPPWEMPGLLASIDYLFHFVVDEPIENPPNLVLEALASGTEILTNQDLQTSDGVHKLDPSDIHTCANYLGDFISDYPSHKPNGQAKLPFLKPNRQRYIQQNIEIYHRLLKA